MFSLSKGKIDELYASLQSDFNIEDNGELNKYVEIYLDRCLDGSIHMSHPYLTQTLLNVITGMERSSAKPNPPSSTCPSKK